MGGWVRQIKEDLAAECAKHGAVVGVRIPAAAGSPDRGKAFVYFEVRRHLNSNK